MVKRVWDWIEGLCLGIAIILAIALIASCTRAEATDSPASTPELTWTVVDDHNGWRIETACATDGIRLFRHQANAAIAAVADHTCDK